jgi:multiple sugar transport system permease protein
LTLRRREAVVPYLLVGPAIAGLLVFRAYPIALALWQSLNQQTLEGAQRFAGAANYLTVLTDPQFWNAARVTLVFNLITNPLQISLALALALLVNRRLPGIALFRTAYFLPMTVSLAITATIWNLILNPELGLANGLLQRVGLPRQPFLISERQALASIIALATWKGVGYWMVFLLAGLQQIPATLYEAASLDGATAWRRFGHVTFPLLRRVLAFVLVADTAINVLMFVPIYLLTGGGPNGSTTLLMFHAYRAAFVFLDWGQATAISILILLVILAMTAAQLRLLRAEFEY